VQWVASAPAEPGGRRARTCCFGRPTAVHYVETRTWADRDAGNLAKFLLALLAVRERTGSRGWRRKDNSR
jgi:hypothetical protein